MRSRLCEAAEEAEEAMAAGRGAEAGEAAEGAEAGGQAESVGRACMLRGNGRQHVQSLPALLPLKLLLTPKYIYAVRIVQG